MSEAPSTSQSEILRLIAINLTEMVMAYDMNRKLVFVNPAVETLTGYSPRELEQENFICWIHPDDRHLLADPMAGISAESAQMLLGGDYTFAEPDDVAELKDGQSLELAGLQFVVDHTPGHTKGSVTFTTPYEVIAGFSSAASNSLRWTFWPILMG